MERDKYPINGYAPGEYYCKCRDCGERYLGDKRSWQCEKCAVEQKESYVNYQI